MAKLSASIERHNVDDGSYLVLWKLFLKGQKFMKSYLGILLRLLRNKFKALEKEFS